MENANDPNWLSKIKNSVIENIRRAGAPSTQMQDVPREPLMNGMDSDAEDEADDLDADANPDVRMTQRQQDKRIVRDDEFEESDHEEERPPLRHKQRRRLLDHLDENLNGLSAKNAFPPTEGLVISRPLNANGTDQAAPEIASLARAEGTEAKNQSYSTPADTEDHMADSEMPEGSGSADNMDEDDSEPNGLVIEPRQPSLAAQEDTTQLSALASVAVPAPMGVPPPSPSSRQAEPVEAPAATTEAPQSAAGEDVEMGDDEPSEPTQPAQQMTASSAKVPAVSVENDAEQEPIVKTEENGVIKGMDPAATESTAPVNGIEPSPMDAKPEQ